MIFLSRTGFNLMKKTKFQIHNTEIIVWNTSCKKKMIILILNSSIRYDSVFCNINTHQLRSLGIQL